MDAKKLWQYYFRRQPFDLTTPRNKIFTVEMTSASMRFPSPTDQTRSISYDRFNKWFDLWFVKEYRENKYFTNEPGSPAAAWNKVKVLFNSFEEENYFEYLTEFERIKSPVLPPDHAELPDIIKSEIVRFKRDTKIITGLKNLYSYKCQLCGFTFTRPSGEKYVEAHHIKPLGRGHRGNDSIENLIIVCPNHHAMLDYGAMQLNLECIKLIPPHKLNQKSIQYHNEIICAQ